MRNALNIPIQALAQSASARRLALIAVAVLAAKGVVLGGVLWAPLAPGVFGIDAPVNEISDSVVERLCRWDCGWYAAIMAHGYAETPPDSASGEVNWAFFPAFPLLAGLLSAVAGLSPLVGAVLFNCCLAVVATLLLHALARECLGRRAALAAALLFAFSPFSLYLVVPYTEALYNALSLGAALLACRRRWLACGLCMALLTATRPTGILIAPAIAMAAWKLGVCADMRRGRLDFEATRFVLCLLLLPLGLAIYMAYLALHTGDALAFAHAQAAWGQNFHEPLSRLFSFLGRDDGRHRYNAIGAVLGLVAAVCLWRLNAAPFGRPAALFLALTILISTASSIASLARFAWALWPPYLLLGVWLGRSPGATAAACALFAGLLFGASAIWAYGWHYLV